MKAIRLENHATDVVMAEIDKPVARADGVVIKLLAAPVLSYMQRVIDGTLPYQLPPTPFVPGTDVIGRIEQVGAEVFDLEPGVLVHAGAQIASRGGHHVADDCLIGLTGMTAASPRVQAIWNDGAFAAYAHYPVDCVTPLPQLDGTAPAQLAALMFLNIAYGGLLAVELRPGDSVIIGGATGNFGAHAVLVALAMGAARVIPTGRKTDVLDQLQALAPERVSPVELCDSPADDTAAICAAAGGGADCHLDITGGGGTAPVLAAMRALKPKGRVALMGALQEPIQLPYAELMVRGLTIKGNFMYPQQAPAKLAEMIAAGLIPLERVQPMTFPLSSTSDALQAAARCNGLRFVVLTDDPVA
jgi:alcohol dehydrogenase